MSAVPQSAMSQAVITALTPSKSSIPGARTVKPARSVSIMMFFHFSFVSNYWFVAAPRTSNSTQKTGQQPYNSMPLHANQLRAQFFSFIEVLACPQFLLVDIVLANDIQPGRLVYACGASSALIVNIESQLEFDLSLGTIGSIRGLKRSFVRLDDY